jgi:phage repressor protein C with HTH and peptisase S24 domain
MQGLSISVPEKLSTASIPAMKWGTRLRHKLDDLGWSLPKLASEMGRPNDAALIESLGKYVNDRVENPRGSMMRDIARAVGMTEIELRTGNNSGRLDIHSRNGRAAGDTATMGGAVTLTRKIPIYGQAMGGRHGEFPLNGNRITDILAPASLDGVVEAYAVYVAGTSMEPRYFAGEAVFVHPKLAYSKGDFVVAQIRPDDREDDGTPPLAYVKRYISMDARRLRLEQLNPKKILEFPARRVVSIHLIIMAGRG